MRISLVSGGQDRDSRAAIKPTKIAMTIKNIGTYLIICQGVNSATGLGNARTLTMARRFFLNLMLNIGACICFDGRSQTASN
jgi:hypothetical protein